MTALHQLHPLQSVTCNARNTPVTPVTSVTPLKGGCNAVTVAQRVKTAKGVVITAIPSPAHGSQCLAGGGWGVSGGGVFLSLCEKIGGQK